MIDKVESGIQAGARDITRIGALGERMQDLGTKQLDTYPGLGRAAVTVAIDHFARSYEEPMTADTAQLDDLLGQPNGHMHVIDTPWSL